LLEFPVNIGTNFKVKPLNINTIDQYHIHSDEVRDVLVDFVVKISVFLHFLPVLITSMCDPLRIFIIWGFIFVNPCLDSVVLT